MKNFIIFGGSGFVGTHLIDLLDSKNISSVIYDLVEPKNKKSDYIYGDVRKSINIKAHQDDIVINLAAIHKTPGHFPEEYFETNIKGAENVCDFARVNNIKTIIFTSSISVYGTYESVKSEYTMPMPDIPYGISKINAEYIHKKWHAEDPKNRRLIILRPGVVFGKYERANFTRLVNSLKHNYFAYVGRKDTKKACIYVKDLAHVIYKFSMENKTEIDIFNVSYHPSLSIEEIVTIISKNTNMNSFRFVIPRFIIIFLSSIIYHILRKKDFNPKRMDKLVISNDIDASKLKNKIKFHFGFLNGIKDWMKETDFLIKKKIF